MALNVTQASYEAINAEGSPGKGIGGYDLKSAADRVFTYDYTHSGTADHLVLIRPGTGTVSILKREYIGRYKPVRAFGDPGTGIGGYDLRSSADRAFAFDYDHSGKLDHIALYRPGTGTFWIIGNNNGNFYPVYQQGDPGEGIGGYDLKSSKDLAFAFDYDHTGKQDHIVLYRPGTGTLWILKNENGKFQPVYQQGDPGQGIGGYDLRSERDRAFAFDYDHSGNLDHIALYRPGTGTIWILRNRKGKFESVYQQGDPGSGIGGYDLKSASDRVFAFDNDASGRADHLVLYRPGEGAIFILKNFSGEFLPVYAQGDPGKGIGGYDLKDGEDLALGIDYAGLGRSNNLTLYRPGTGTIRILNRVRK